MRTDSFFLIYLQSHPRVFVIWPLAIILEVLGLPIAVIAYGVFDPIGQ